MEIKKFILGRIDNNTYIVSKGKDCLVIDPSMEYEKIISYIKEQELNVKGILITHAHYDHVYSLFELVRDTGAPVYMHEDDMGLYDAAIKRINSVKVNIDHLLKGGEVLNLLGEDIQVLHCPGHADGCVCYIIGDNMFTGDFIFKGSIGRTDLETSKPDKMKESLKKFVSLDKNYNIFCGHGDDTTYFEELQTNPFLAGRM